MIDHKTDYHSSGGGGDCDCDGRAPFAAPATDSGDSGHDDCCCGAIATPPTMDGNDDDGGGGSGTGTRNSSLGCVVDTDANKSC